MNCRELREEYDSILDTKPPHLLTEEMTEHIRSCEACRRYVQEMEEIDAALRTAADIEIQPWLDTRLKAIPAVCAPRTSLRSRLAEHRQTALYVIPPLLAALMAVVFVTEGHLFFQIATAVLTLGTLVFQRVRRSPDTL
jgi:anti-sigma factor RsiW